MVSRIHAIFKWKSTFPLYSYIDSIVDIPSIFYSSDKQSHYLVLAWVSDKQVIHTSGMLKQFNTMDVRNKRNFNYMNTQFPTLSKSRDMSNYKTDKKALSNHLKWLPKKEFLSSTEKKCLNINIPAREFNIWRRTRKPSKFHTWILCGIVWVVRGDRDKHRAILYEFPERS